VPAASLAVVETLVLEPVKVGFEGAGAAATILAEAARAGAVALGPGLGRDEATRALVRELLSRLELPVVVDADALFGLEPVERAAPTVLTPHAGELARLLGREAAWVGAHRLETHAAGRAVAGPVGSILRVHRAGIEDRRRRRRGAPVIPPGASHERNDDENGEEWDDRQPLHPTPTRGRNRTSFPTAAPTKGITGVGGRWRRRRPALA